MAGGGGGDTIFGGSAGGVFRDDADNGVFYSRGGADRFAYAPGRGYDQPNGFTQGAARLDFTGAIVRLGGQWFWQGNGNCQVGSAVTPSWFFEMTALNNVDFLF